MKLQIHIYCQSLLKHLYKLIQDLRLLIIHPESYYTV